METKIGQRYQFDKNTRSSFIGEVVEIVNDQLVKLLVVQDLGYGFAPGKIWHHERVQGSNYTYLEGQDKPSE